MQDLLRTLRRVPAPKRLTPPWQVSWAGRWCFWCCWPRRSSPQAPLAFLLAFALVLLVLLRLDAAYLRRQVTAELLVPDKPVIQGEDFTLTVRLRNRSRLPIPALVVLLNAADEWGGGQITRPAPPCWAAERAPNSALP